VFKAVAKSFFLVLVFSLSNCTKEEINPVGGNTAPVDPTISNNTKNNYINKVFIKLLDRKADSIEFKAALELLNQDPGSQSKRKEVLNLIKANSEYPHVMWKNIRELLLDGTDTATINDEYIDLKDDWSTATGSTKDVLEYEWKRLELILDGAEKFENKTSTWEELQLAACNNLIYDDINMGSENFVVSVFQSLLNRYPTIEELDAAKDMVDGRPAILFLKTGQTKDDFLDIFFSVRSYQEGQVSLLFNDNLFRSPNSSELINYTNYYIEQNDFESLLLEILSSAAYFN
jgi:hypothetical protein